MDIHFLTTCLTVFRLRNVTLESKHQYWQSTFSNYTVHKNKKTFYFSDTRGLKKKKKKGKTKKKPLRNITKNTVVE